MEALGDLARGSSLGREKSEVAKMQAHIESVSPVDPVAQQGKMILDSVNTLEEKPDDKEGINIHPLTEC